MKTIAEAFDISGSVSNRADGGVEIVAAGTLENLRAFKEQVELGPAGARVDRVETEHLPDERYSGFAIVRQ